MTPEAISKTLAEATARHAEAERLLTQGNPKNLPVVIEQAQQSLQLLEALPVESRSGTHELEAGLWLVHGNALRDTQNPELRPTALQSYDKAQSLLEGRDPSPTPSGAQLPSNIWTNRGITLLQSPEETSLTEALACFDKAIAIRKALPRDMHNVLWGLAAGYMNRGDAITRLGKPEQLPEAVQAFDEAITCLEELGTYDHPPFVGRVAVAWMNRGHTLMAMGTTESVQRAADSFQKSVDTLKKYPQRGVQHYDCTLGCTLMCHAAASIERGPEASESIATDTREALGLVRPYEKESLFASDVGIKSRHLLCRALATLLERGTPDFEQGQGWMDEITDVVDEGMSLERLWEQRGLQDFRFICTDLFRFGIRVYLMQQPHFLAEFILECLDPAVSPGAPADSEEMHHIASSAVWDAALEVERKHKAATSDAERAPLIELVQELHHADRRLQELRQGHLPQA